MDSTKPYDVPQWRPGNEHREAMCCSFCGGRNHLYEDCSQRDAADGPSLDDPEGASPESD